MKKRIGVRLMTVTALFMAAATVAFAQPSPPVADQHSLDQEIEVRAVVEEAFMNPDREGEYGPGTRVQEVTLTITSGELRGESLSIDNAHFGNPAYDLVVEPGDRVLLGIQGGLDEMEDVYIKDFVRDRYLYLIVGAFLVLLLVIGRMKGLKTIITLGLTILLIVYLLIPGILRGYSPILLAVVISSIVTLITLFIISGVNAKSASAIIGILGGVFIAGLITLWIGAQTHLTGFTSEEAMLILDIPSQVQLNVRGLLFAGIIIGSMGAVMDVGISVASSMQEVIAANPRISNADLRRAGFNVGRDIMGTMANTLILAYAGSSIPLLILFSAYEASFGEIVNLDVIATEVVRALAGSIGLILAVPITVYAGAVLMGKSRRRLENGLEGREF